MRGVVTFPVSVVALLFSQFAFGAMTCLPRNCSDGMDCLAASREQANCRRATELARQKEHEARLEVDRRRSRPAVDPSQKMDEATKRPEAAAPGSGTNAAGGSVNPGTR
jgi:hypothetical protein